MDYEEDAHFCLKCHSTIMGLNNYVTHRKNATCRKVNPDPSKSPLEEVEEEIGLKADDFFSSLELRSSSSIKPVASTSGKNFSGILTRSKFSAVLQASISKEPVESKSGKNVWIGGNQLKDLGTGDNQSKLIKAVANLERRKDAAPADSPPKIAGGAVYEDSDDDSEVFDYEEDETSDEDEPPQGHTGGKWKPSSPVPWQPPNLQGGGKRPTCPPPTYTKGKWKPTEEEAVTPPMAGGKFAPTPAPPTPGPEPKKRRPKPKRALKPLKSPPVRRQFRCRPCNRSLASKVVFQRHLCSELHRKRSGTQPLRARPLPESLATPPSRKRRRLSHMCAVCCAKVKKPLMGKHLISHYHFSRGDISSPANQQLVLDNILGVVLECPFQCNMCKFYCNTLSQFIAHWRTGAHLAEAQKRPDGHFLCDFCRHKAPTSEQMLNHLESAEHLEVAQVINRSVPICIRRIQEIPCPICGRRFVLNRQLLSHYRLHHPQPMGGDVHPCGRCLKVLGSALSLQQHLRRAHQEPSYFCSTCAQRFQSGEEARKHRLSIQHRYARLDKAKDGRQRRRCQHCGDMFQNFLLLKEHLGLRHPEHKVRCPQCGAQFIIPQELTNHLKNCTFPTGAPSQSSSFSCDQCAYSSNSSAELLFHMALHGAPVLGPDTSTRPKLKCPLCERFFPRNSLQAHLRIHTQERPYECKICNARFARKNNLQNHQKNHERVPTAPPRAATGPDDRAFLCSTCGTGFNRRFTLQQHMLIHSGKNNRCPEPGCSFTARKKSELDEHQLIHSSERLHGCDICEYRSKTKKLLKRHMDVHEGVAGKRYQCSVCAFATRTAGNLRRHARLHTGAKPYQCPYCEFKCNDMDNLRRHVLGTSKHPGKCVYECRFCKGAPPFQTNVAKQFKAHLTCSHADEFSDGPKAASYISGIYEAQEDNTFLMEVDNVDDPPEEAIDRLTTNKDPVVAQPPDAPSHDLPLFIVPDNAALAPWSLIGRYDVEESGILVPFQNSDEDDLFQAHF